MSTANILILDSADARRLDMMVKYFSKYGYHALPASSAPEACQSLKNNDNLQMVVFVAVSDPGDVRETYNLFQEIRPVPVVLLENQPRSVDFMSEMDEVVTGPLKMSEVLPNLVQKVKNVSRKLRYGSHSLIQTAVKERNGAPEALTPVRSEEQPAERKPQNRKQSKQKSAPEANSPKPVSAPSELRGEGKGKGKKGAAAQVQVAEVKKPSSPLYTKNNTPAPQSPAAAPAPQVVDDKAEVPRQPEPQRKEPKLILVEQMKFGDMRVTMDRQTEQILVNGQDVSFTASEYILMKYLLENRNRLLSREDIIQSSNAMSKETSARSVDAAIRKLRRKIGDDAKEPVIIKTIWGKGYILEEN
ncbi:transcriptional regulator domain-containing protein [Desulfurispirillum indicum S5]|uniref:Transcriptional regulator domain-containing protein n=1 Tax=Desulfurispirillum indicum (strain ATCC BAA-1389 / DSM 22839 / S5) TaxID=653733 RepID=E6W1X3_DESIS|nr:winged helix-turn-helix domain-containing protein [Desulfurispirillum indicum]ADU65505.1 transcriptional regulator domain-containing protein [Desulfurispirillum indicum S5]